MRNQPIGAFKMKENTKRKIPKLAILVVLLIVVVSVAWAVNSGLNGSIDETSDVAIEERLTNTLAESGFDVKSVEVSGRVAHIYLYDVGTLPDYRKKQIITILTDLAHHEISKSGGTVVYLHDEFDVQVASARYDSTDDSIKDVELY